MTTIAASRTDVRAATALLAAVAVTVVVPWVGMNAGLWSEEQLASLDPDRAFVYSIVHKLAIAAIALGLMLLVSRDVRRWGLQAGDWRAAIPIVAVFGVIVTALNIAVDGLPYLLSGTEPGIPFWPTARNVIGVLLFQFVVVAIGEELFFRGLVHGLLWPSFGRRVRLGFFTVSVAGLVSAVVFGIAHGIYYERWSPLAITWNPGWPQVVYATILGVYYAALKERTGSLLGPIVSHGISDGTLWVVTFVVIAANG
jgi:membrane protease YdiL (CAAX protease family)